MLDSCTNINGIIKKWCSWLIFHDKESSDKNLPEEGNSVSINHKYTSNIETLATEMFKVKHKLYSEIVIRFRKLYWLLVLSNNLRNRTVFVPPQVHSVYHGAETITHDTWAKDMRYCSSRNWTKELVKKLWRIYQNEDINKLPLQTLQSLPRFT